MIYLSVFPDQTITNEISGFNETCPFEVCACELSIGDNDELINEIDFKPTSVKAFYFTEDGDAIKIIFTTKDGERTFTFDNYQDESFDFQDEADAAYFSRRNS